MNIDNGLFIHRIPLPTTGILENVSVRPISIISKSVEPISARHLWARRPSKYTVPQQPAWVWPVIREDFLSTAPGPKFHEHVYTALADSTRIATYSQRNSQD